MPDLTDVRDQHSAPEPKTSRLFHLSTDPKPVKPSPVSSKPKTMWCKSHVQQRPVEEEPPVKMEYKEWTTDQQFPIYTPLPDMDAEEFQETVSAAVNAAVNHLYLKVSLRHTFFWRPHTTAGRSLLLKNWEKYSFSRERRLLCSLARPLCQK